MKKIFRIGQIICAATILFLATGCNKEELAKILGIPKSDTDSNTKTLFITDVDGNTYKTVTIGSQCWMAENLKTKKYSNGDLIGTTSPATLDIGAEASPKYQWAFNGNESNVATYGRLYTWYAVTDPRNVCPTGWHVPTDAEWNTLTTFLGGICVAGGELNDDNGFNALPAGWRYIDGSFFEIEISGQWWSSTRYDADNAWYRYVRRDSAWGYDWNNLLGISFQGVTRDGFSVRCIQDNENPSIPTFSTWEAPTVTTQYATNISKTGATLNGTVNANGLPTTVTFEYQNDDGRGWQEVSQAVIAVQSPLTGNTETEVSATLAGLADGTYIFKVKAENCLGTVWSLTQESFDIGGQAPAATTLAATNLASGTATLNCTANASSILTGVDFEYGTTTSYGQESNASHITGNTSTNLSCCITGLTNGVTYHYRVRAANSIGLAYGNDMEFTLNAPTAETLEATDLTSTTATLNGIVNANTFSSNVTFEYGTTTSYGQEVTPEQSPVTGNAGTNVSATLAGLTCGIKYHFRVKAENSSGISYG